MERLLEERAEIRRVDVPAPLGPYVASVTEARIRRGERWVALPSVWFRLGATIVDDGAVPHVALTLGGLHAAPGVFEIERCGREIVALLTPRGAIATFGRPLGATAQRRVALADLLGARVAADLAGRMSAAASPAQALMAWLAERTALPLAPRSPGHRSAELADALCGTSSARTLTVGELARAHEVSRRQLERDFAEWTGMAPGAFRRLVRFQRAARDVVAGGSLAVAALQAGYADQSHMTNAMRTFALLTPSVLARQAQRAQQGLEALADGRMLFLEPKALSEGGTEITKLPAACPFTRLRPRRSRRLGSA